MGGTSVPMPFFQIAST
ncbi:DUF6053 domain-containing protein [Lysobacter enzymogenes]